MWSLTFSNKKIEFTADGQLLKPLAARTVVALGK